MPGATILLLIGLAIAWTALVLYTLWMLTHPPRRTTAWAVSRGRAANPRELTPPYGPSRDYREWTLRTPRGNLPVWEFAGDDPRGPIVIVTHGWGESRVIALLRAGPLAAHACKVLVWDLPGHGDAPGSSTLGVHEPECLRLLMEAAGEPERERWLVGSSLGAGICIAACAQTAAANPQGADRLGRNIRLLLEAPYRLPQTPARNVLSARALPWRLNLIPALRLAGWRHGAPRGWLRSGGPFDRARLASRLTGVEVRVLVGDRDDICPPEEARAIADTCGASVHVVAGADHSNLWTDFLPATLAALRAD